MQQDELTGKITNRQGKAQIYAIHQWSVQKKASDQNQPNHDFIWSLNKRDH